MNNKLIREIRAITVEFNKTRTTRRRKKDLITKAMEIRRELFIKGYSPEQVKSMEMGEYK